MPEFGLPLVCDVILLLLCAALLLTQGRISAMHPSVIYLFYHVYTVTFRLLALRFGAPLSRIVYSVVQPEEVVRSAIACDLALVCVTLVWLLLARFERRHPRGRQPALKTPRLLSPKYVQTVAWVAVVVGTIAMRYLAFNDSAVLEQRREGLGAWSGSTWIGMTVTWAQQGLLLLHYVRGFGPVLTTFTALVFAISAVSNSRYVLVVWGLFFCFIYLSRERLRWPPMWMAMLLAGVGVVWFPLKIITKAYWAGDSPQTIISKAIDYSTGSLADSSGDTVFLDQMGATMTLVDEHGQYFYGSTLGPLLVAPVPRPWWPEKPPLNQFQFDISTTERPVGAAGAITMLAGEGYANFGWLGVVLYPAIMAYCYGKAYYGAMYGEHTRLARFFYLVIAASLIQVLRDGLISAFVFTLIGAMPMMFVVYWHVIFPPRAAAIVARPRRLVARVAAVQ